MKRQNNDRDDYGICDVTVMTLLQIVSKKSSKSLSEFGRIETVSLYYDNRAV